MQTNFIATVDIERRLANLEEKTQAVYRTRPVFSLFFTGAPVERRPQTGIVHQKHRRHPVRFPRNPLE